MMKIVFQILIGTVGTAAILGGADAGPAPSMSTGAFADNRSHSECLEYAAKVMEVIEIEHIRITRFSVYGQSQEINFAIRCETDAKTVFFVAGGGGENDGDRVEHLLQVLMRQFQITKDLPKCRRDSSPLHLCQ
jgi:hypothetical protein